jgi:hypothetical protein
MEHFYTNIQGWFDFQNHYTNMVNSAHDGAHFVEVGSWKGTSSAYMAVEIANSGKKIKFDCVDTWQGSDEQAHHQDHYVASNSLYEHFIENMKPAEGYYNPVRMTSVAAAELYEDGSLDFVFIDAGHKYEEVYADIVAWLPKVKKGGWIGGHDYPWVEGVRRACNELVPGHVPDPSWNVAEDRWDPSFENCSSWMHLVK